MWICAVTFSRARQQDRRRCYAETSAAGSMASLGQLSQVSIDDILEYTSNNEELLLEPPVQDGEQVPDIVPESLPQPDDPPPLDAFQGYHPNTDVYAINKQELGYRAGKSFVPLAPPTAQMLQNAAKPRTGELIPQDHPEWQNLRSGSIPTHCTMASPAVCPLCIV